MNNQDKYKPQNKYRKKNMKNVAAVLQNEIVDEFDKIIEPLSRHAALKILIEKVISGEIKLNDRS